MSFTLHLTIDVGIKQKSFCYKTAAKVNLPYETKSRPPAWFRTRPAHSRCPRRRSLSCHEKAEAARQAVIRAVCRPAVLKRFVAYNLFSACIGKLTGRTSSVIILYIPSSSISVTGSGLFCKRRTSIWSIRSSCRSEQAIKFSKPDWGLRISLLFNYKCQEFTVGPC